MGATDTRAQSKCCRGKLRKYIVNLDLRLDVGDSLRRFLGIFIHVIEITKNPQSILCFVICRPCTYRLTTCLMPAQKYRQEQTQEDCWYCCNTQQTWTCYKTGAKTSMPATGIQNHMLLGPRATGLTPACTGAYYLSCQKTNKETSSK